MTSEFDLIYDDFAAELEALEGVISSLGGNSAVPGRARVAGANAATLLLAAIFEEYVRQSVRAVFRIKARNSTSISDFPPKIAANVWRRSLENLARIPFEDVKNDSTSVNLRIASTVNFCIGNDLSSDVSESLSHNENNMRPQQLNALFNQVGLTNMCGRACDSAALVGFLGAENSGKATAILEEKVDDFFRRRNEIAHAVQLNSSSGPTSLNSDIELFRIFSKAIAHESAKYVEPPISIPRQSQARRARSPRLER